MIADDHPRLSWVALWTVVTGIGAIGVTASINSIRFRRRVAREVRDLAAQSATPPPWTSPSGAACPAPVRRYLDKALGARSQPIRMVRVRHRGTFRPSLNGSWLPIEGRQHFTADPPGFVWWGRVRLAPGLWIDARDRPVGGVGSMFVTAESTFTLADSAGPQLDQGALLRLLGEMAFFPTAFADERYVRWSGIDDRHAAATLEVNGHSVAGTFEFGADDLPVTFTADRYRDVGGGQSVLTPFVGRISDYRVVDDVIVPHCVAAAWIIDGRPCDYARFDVEELAFTGATLPSNARARTPGSRATSSSR